GEERSDGGVEPLRGGAQRRTEVLARGARGQWRKGVGLREAALDAQRQRLVALARQERVAERHGAATGDERRDRGVALLRAQAGAIGRLVRRVGGVERREEPRRGGRRRAPLERGDRSCPAPQPLAR